MVHHGNVKDKIFLFLKKNNYYRMKIYTIPVMIILLVIIL